MSVAIIKPIRQHGSLLPAERVSFSADPRLGRAIPALGWVTVSVLKPCTTNPEPESS